MKKIRTDLAIEAREMCEKEKAEENHLDGIDVEEYDSDGVFVTVITVKNKKGSDILGKPPGRYITIEAPDLKYSKSVYESACAEIARRLRSLFNITNETKTLVAGLGNKSITPDALGPDVVSKLMVTNHLKTRSDGFSDCGSVCAVSPGVLGTTGIETGDIIKGITDRISPDLVIAVDALASRSVSRISTTIQISDTGICPGSGVENKRRGINEKTLGIPVIAIGVPTVVDAATIAADCISGAYGENADRHAVLSSANAKGFGSMMVTPKDIDAVIERCAKTVANGINLALHPDLSLEDIESYVG